MTNLSLDVDICLTGGAFDAGAVYSSDGTFSFYSYKDPLTLRSYEAFEKAA